MILFPPSLPREELDFQLSPSKSAKDPMGVLHRHVHETAALQNATGLTVSHDVAYGAGARQSMDICRPIAQSNAPCLVFVHGGFWQEGHKDGSGFAAQNCAAAGWAHVGVGYSLAPDARLGEIVNEIAAALVALRRLAPAYGIDPDRLVVAGHSAGGHLVSSIMAGFGGAEAAQAIAGAILISGVYELAPIAASYVNDAVAMDANDIAQLSPMRAKPLHDIPTQILIGGDETDAFKWQSKTLYDVWKPHLSRLSLLKSEGRDHFDILDVLSDPTSAPFASLKQIIK